MPLPQKLSLSQRLTRSFTTQNQFDMYTQYGAFRDENDRQRTLLESQNDQMVLMADSQERAHLRIEKLTAEKLKLDRK